MHGPIQDFLREHGGLGPTSYRPAPTVSDVCTLRETYEYVECIESCAPSVFWPLLVLMKVFRKEVANRYFRPSSIRSPLAALRTLNLGVYG